jgi:hypothetical protein
VPKNQWIAGPNAAGQANFSQQPSQAAANETYAAHLSYICCSLLYVPNWIVISGTSSEIDIDKRTVIAGPGWCVSVAIG